MKKHTSALLALLFLVSWTWAGAQEIEVKVAGDRTAVIHVNGSESPNSDVSGDFKSSIDLTSGKSALKADLTVNDEDAKGVKAGLYGTMTEKTIEAIGFIDAKVPSEPDAPKVLDIKAETVTEGDLSAANFNINLAFPAEKDVPNGSGSAKLSGDFKAIKSSGDFKFSGGNIKGDEIPFSNLDFVISEEGNKTSVSFTMKYKKDSSIAQTMAQLPKQAGMIGPGLESKGIKSEGIEFPEPTAEGDLMVSKGKLTLIDIRAAIRPGLGFMAAGMQGDLGADVDAKGALEKMLEVKLDKLEIKFNVAATDMDGGFEFNVSNMDKFYEGYFIVIPAFQKMQHQEMAREIRSEFGPAAPIFLAFWETLNKQGVEAMKVMVSSKMTVEGDMKFDLQAKEQDMTFNADGKLMSKGYEDYVTKAKAAKIPVAEKAVAQVELKLQGGTDLVGDMYLYSDGDFIPYYKTMLVDSAKSGGAPDEIVGEFEKLKLNSLGMKMTLQDGKLSLEGKSDTSELASLVKSVASMAAPQFQAKLTGMSVDMAMPQGEATKIDAKINFSEFFPGADEATIKESLGLPGSTKVTMDASGDDTKLVAVEQPSLALEGRLAEVQSEGQKLLASSPADVGGGGGGGGNNWGLIAIGGLLIVGVLGFLMFGKKS